MGKNKKEKEKKFKKKNKTKVYTFKLVSVKELFYNFKKDLVDVKENWKRFVW